MSDVIITNTKRLVAVLVAFVLASSLLVSFQISQSQTNPDSAFNSVVPAKANSIGYEGDPSGIVPQYSSPAACRSGCTPGGANNGGGVVNPNVKTVFYSCTSMSGNTCRIAGRMAQDISKMVEIPCYNIGLKYNGNIVALGGSASVSYLRNHLLGPWYWPGNPEEQMFRYLTGWWLPGIPSFADLAGVYYNGNRGPVTYSHLYFGCLPSYEYHKSYTTTTDSCSARNDGRAFPYAVGISVTYTNYDTKIVKNHQNKEWRETGKSCVYVSRNSEPPKVLDASVRCYWNYNHVGYFSTNRASILNGGTKTTNAPAVRDRMNAREPYVTGSGSNSSLQGCTTGTEGAVLNLADGYAYYRLQSSANYRDYNFFIWDTRWTQGVKKLAKIAPSGSGKVTYRKAYGAFSCSNNPPFRQYNSYSALPGQGSIVFDYSDCPTIKGGGGVCEIVGSPQINNVAIAVQLMRDGKNVPFTLPSVRITGSDIRDSQTKNKTIASSSARYMVSVKDGSTPLKAGERGNSTKKFQYVTLRNANGVTEESFNTWVDDPNGNRNKNLAFYWSSDAGGKWTAIYKAEIKPNGVELRVPYQDTADGPVYYRWKVDTNGMSCGPELESNPATILRSVTSP